MSKRIGGGGVSRKIVHDYKFFSDDVCKVYTTFQIYSDGVLRIHEQDESEKRYGHKGKEIYLTKRQSENLRRFLAGRWGPGE